MFYVNRENLQGSSKCSAEISLIFWEKPGQAEVSDPRLKFFIKENITRFNIPVNNSDVRILMKIL